MPGKPWTAQETAQLRGLWEQTHDLNGIAKAMNKSVEAVRMKLTRLGLVVVEQPQKQCSTTRDRVDKGGIEKLAKMLRILSFLTQTKVYLFWKRACLSSSLPHYNYVM